MAPVCNPGMLQISCNLITAFHHCLTSIYCIKRSTAINYEPVSAFVYLCQALSAATRSVEYRSPLSPICSQLRVGGRLAAPSSLMWTERLRGIKFGGSGVLCLFTVDMWKWSCCCPSPMSVYQGANK